MIKIDILGYGIQMMTIKDQWYVACHRTCLPDHEWDHMGCSIGWCQETSNRKIVEIFEGISTGYGTNFHPDLPIWMLKLTPASIWTHWLLEGTPTWLLPGVDFRGRDVHGGDIILKGQMLRQKRGYVVYQLNDPIQNSKWTLLLNAGTLQRFIHVQNDSQSYLGQ